MIPSSDLVDGHGTSMTVNLNDHSMALKISRLASQPSQPKFSWEQNNWLGHVFGKRDSVVDEIFQDRAKFEKKRPTAGSTKPFYLDATSKTTVEDVRARLCTEWVNIVLINWEAFEFSKMLMNHKRSVSRAELLDSMMAAMAPKATSTLSKRLSS